MNLPRPISRGLSLFGAVGLAGCASSAGLALPSKNPAPILAPFEELTFRRPIPIVAPEMAALWGDRTLGASGNEEKQPAGKISALHVHPNDTYAMVIAGRMTHAFEGGPAAVELGPGSFYTLPAGAPHVSACLEGSECLIVYWQPGKLGYQEVKTGSLSGITPGIARPSASITLAPGEAGELPATRLWGDPARGNTGTLEGQEPGTAAPTPPRAGDVHGVVIAGRATLSIGGGAGRTLGPGSYYVVPAGMACQRRCEGPAACRYLTFQPEPTAPGHGGP